jgi:hypothetical protein
LYDREAPWYDFLLFRYGSLEANILHGEGRDVITQAFIWWRDIWRLGSKEDGGWFDNNIRIVVGDGNVICFWKG